MTEQTLIVRGWSVPKLNETQNDDSWAADEAARLVAIADGVSQASYSREWAEVLVNGFVSGLFEVPENISLFETELVPLREQWWNLVPWDRLTKKGYPFDWKAKQGGFSTFLGLRVHNGAFSAFAIGDCNLFVVSYNSKFKDSWPLSSEGEFGNMPMSIRSVKLNRPNDPHSDRNVFGAIKRIQSPLQSGDCIVICSDALSAFLLRHKNRNELWWTLLSLDNSSHEEFARWIDRLRTEGLKNDDTTAVVIETLQVD